ncbi:MAG: TraB/GumN family protein, partial [Chitinophagaceae bacterium]
MFFLLFSFISFSQSSKIKADKYPSLLWEIRGKGLQKPSYLFGTMHVSSKMAFNLSDSFYLGI